MACAEEACPSGTGAGDTQTDLPSTTCEAGPSTAAAPAAATSQAEEGIAALALEFPEYDADLIGAMVADQDGDLEEVRFYLRVRPSFAASLRTVGTHRMCFRSSTKHRCDGCHPLMGAGLSPQKMKNQSALAEKKAAAAAKSKASSTGGAAAKGKAEAKPAVVASTNPSAAVSDSTGGWQNPKSCWVYCQLSPSTFAAFNERPPCWHCRTCRVLQ